MSNDSIIPMTWKRPNSVDYPKVWHRFKARDLNSNKFVEYRIEDLLEARAKEVFEHMKVNYFPDEPISQALGGHKDIDHIDDFVYAWRSIFAQKMPLVCYKEGSNEIVGVNWTFVSHKDDRFVEKFKARSKSPATKILVEMLYMLYENFDPYQHYGVDEYLTSFGLSVDKRYRGRSIGDHFMATRKIICKEFGLKLTHTIFSSDYSSRNAENVGFKTNVSIRYDEVMKLRPQYNLSNMKSTAMSVKTLVY